MHQSIIVRLCIMAMVPLAAALGWLLYAFMYVLEAPSPLIPMTFGAAIVLMMWAVMDLTDV